MPRLYNTIGNHLVMKKNFALRVDSEIFEAIEKWAADEFRSTNGQIEWILHSALKKAGRLPKKKAPSAQSEQGRLAGEGC